MLNWQGHSRGGERKVGALLDLLVLTLCWSLVAMVQSAGNMQHNPGARLQPALSPNPALVT